MTGRRELKMSRRTTRRAAFGVIMLGLFLSKESHGFSPSGSMRLMSGPRCLERTPRPPTRTLLCVLQSSQRDFDEDEISRLIGKRDEIRKRREPSMDETATPSTSEEGGEKGAEEGAEETATTTTLSSPPSPPPLEGASSDGDADSGATVETMSDDDLSRLGDPGEINWNVMPDLTYKRESITAASTQAYDSQEEEDEDGFGGKEEKKEVLDYMADYKDENELHIPNRMGFSTRDWGDENAGFVPKAKKLKKKERRAGKFLEGDLKVVFDTMMENGILLTDTSESYGIGSRSLKLSAEDILGRCVEEDRVGISPIFATSFAHPWGHLLRGRGRPRVGSGAVGAALSRSCERLALAAVELYQVPTPLLYLGLPGALPSGMASALEVGLCNYAGVTDVTSSAQLGRLVRKLQGSGFTLNTNQFEFSLTNRQALKSGLIRACKDLGVIPIARNPLDGGLASGVYTSVDPTGGRSSQPPFSVRKLEKYYGVHSMLDTVTSQVRTRLERQSKQAGRSRRYRKDEQADFNPEVSTLQVSLNYVIAKGCVPIPSVRTPDEAQEIVGCLGWSLTDEEVEMLDKAASAFESGR